MFGFSFEDGEPILKLVTSGFWTVSDISQFAAEQRQWFDDARRRYSRVLLLVDARETYVQSGDVMAAIQDSRAKELAPGDRVAVILGSRLTRMQVDRFLNPSRSASFLDIPTAKAWLAGGH